MRISELIEQLRQELEIARRPQDAATLRLEECELEVSVEVTAGAQGGVSLTVFGTGITAESDGSRASSHKVRVKFSPLPDRPFNDFLSEMKEKHNKIKEAELPSAIATSILGEISSSSATYINSSFPIILDSSSPKNSE